MLLAQSCPTLCDPMYCSRPGSSVHEIFRARILEWVAISFSNYRISLRENQVEFKLSNGTRLRSLASLYFCTFAFSCSLWLLFLALMQQNACTELWCSSVQQNSATIERSRSVFSSAGSINYTGLLSTWNVTLITEKLNFIVFDFNSKVDSYIWLL